MSFRDGLVNLIAEEDAAALKVLPSSKEIKKAVWDCESSRAPGSDGRMRSVMSDLVGETQSAFVKGRKIHDDALIVCETVHWLKSRKKEVAIIKLNFQKAYDMVKWRFVDIVLQKMDFGRRMIGEAVRNGRISPLFVGIDNIKLSHLQFADDIVLFCPPEEESIKNYKRLLRCFELMSGLSINFEKFCLIPINCDQYWVQSMCSLFECKESALSVKYMGIPPLQE
ncbi:uncharacterized protein LOC130939537 [Arachis stenosperma]|uniref:uncharacterized protein LOC130939537 n=1 Tax=Arachis stenosperma TaxID=217475 RepID=UPI0025AD4A05|nr:uncharacterized protein LOC130939537 [Arachis stenosperma]